MGKSLADQAGQSRRGVRDANDVSRRSDRDTKNVHKPQK
jgi:hypothetical protein